MSEPSKSMLPITYEEKRAAHTGPWRPEIARLRAINAELLGACEEAFPWLDESYRWHRDMQSAPHCILGVASALKRIRAAIAKAGG